MNKDVVRWRKLAEAASVKEHGSPIWMAGWLDFAQAVLRNQNNPPVLRELLRLGQLDPATSSGSSAQCRRIVGGVPAAPAPRYGTVHPSVKHWPLQAGNWLLHSSAVPPQPPLHGWHSNADQCQHMPRSPRLPTGSAKHSL